MATTVVDIQLFRYTKIWVREHSKLEPIDFWETYASFLEYYKERPDMLKRDLKELLPKKTYRKKKKLFDR